MEASLSQSKARHYDWKFFTALGVPLVSVAMAFATMQASLAAQKETTDKLEARLVEIANVKERASVLEAKFGAIDARLERIERYLETIVQTRAAREAGRGR